MIPEKDRNRFMSHVCPEPNSGCWLWTASVDRCGYGRFGFDGSPKAAHRVAYAMFVAEIPEGMTVDHSCWIRSCVNPDHLALATHIANAKKQRSAFKIHCVNGHEFTELTTIQRPGGQRGCRVCMNAAQRAYQKRKKALATRSEKEAV